jgi:hypothetical protein
VVVVQYISILFRCLPNQIIACTKIKCVSRASLHTSGLAILGSTVGAQVALDGMVAKSIISDGTIRTGYDAFSAPCATGFIDLHHPGLLVLGNGRRGTGAQARRSVTVLAGHRQKPPGSLTGITKPDHFIAKFPRTQSMFLLAGCFTALAPDATFEIDDHCQTAHIYFFHNYIPG